MALQFRLHHWHPISTVPCNRDVELRVREGTAISTLEFPCRQTNAGDWINCDLCTSINIRPVAWRVWRHGRSPRPQHLQIAGKGRLALSRRGHRSAKRSAPQVPQEAKPLARSMRRKNLATMAYVLVGMVIVASAVVSLTQLSARALPIGFMEPTPPSAIHVAAVSRPRAGHSCNDFGFSFLNSSCSTLQKKHVFRGPHRVATLVLGHPDAPRN
jgi:hypothetical protein